MNRFSKANAHRCLKLMVNGSGNAGCIFHYPPLFSYSSEQAAAFSMAILNSEIKTKGVAFHCTSLSVGGLGAVTASQ